MLINMLKATSRMMKFDGAEETRGFFARVECARIIIEEIIQSLEKNEKLGAHSDLSAPAVFREPSAREPSVIPPTSKREPNPGAEYLFMVDVEKKLLPVKGLPLEAILELDGRKLTHKEAIGLTFTKARLIDDKSTKLPS